MENNYPYKSIGWWLNRLPEPYRTEALDNAESSKIPEIKKSISAAIIGAFIWAKTQQGRDYWNNVWLAAARGEFDQPDESGNNRGLEPEE